MNALSPILTRRISLAMPQTLGPREQGLRLRRSLAWASAHFPRWHDEVAPLKFGLLLPNLSSARLEATTTTGGTAIVKIEHNAIHLLRVESGWSVTLCADLPKDF